MLAVRPLLVVLMRHVLLLILRSRVHVLLLTPMLRLRLMRPLIHLFPMLMLSILARIVRASRLVRPAVGSHGLAAAVLRLRLAVVVTVVQRLSGANRAGWGRLTILINAVGTRRRVSVVQRGGLLGRNTGPAQSLIQVRVGRLGVVDPGLRGIFVGPPSRDEVADAVDHAVVALLQRITERVLAVMDGSDGPVPVPRHRSRSLAWRS